MNKRITNIIMGLLVVLFMGVLVGCPTEAPKPKEKDAERGPCDVDYRHSPTTNAEFVTAVNKEIADYGDTVDLRYINVSELKSTARAFAGKTTFNGDLSCWNTSKVEDMSRMFNGASAFNGNIGGWDVSKVTGMSQMFQNASAFNQDLSGWDVEKVNLKGDFATGATDWEDKNKPTFP